MSEIKRPEIPEDASLVVSEINPNVSSVYFSDGFVEIFFEDRQIGDPGMALSAIEAIANASNRGRSHMDRNYK